MRATRIFIHCSATQNGKDLPDGEIRKWHLARGWTDVGYHAIIHVDGRVERGRGLNEQGAHCEGENEDSIAVCLVGGLEPDPKQKGKFLDGFHGKYTQSQWDALRYLLDSWTQNLNIPKWAIECHNEARSAQKQGKICPSIRIAPVLAWYLTGDEKPILAHKFKKSDLL